MNWIKKYELFLFDFDGLLVDTEPLHFEAYRRVCANRGFRLDWDFATFCKIAHAKASGMRDGLYGQFPGLFDQEPNWAVLYAEKKQAYEKVLRESPLELMPGAYSLLKALDQEGIARCVVTNSPRSQVEEIRGLIPILQTIPLWLTREDYELPKPSAEGYLKAIALSGKKGESVIGFEDSLKGLQALHGSGALPILVCPREASYVQECSKLGALHFSSLEEVSL